MVMSTMERENHVDQTMEKQLKAFTEERLNQADLQKSELMTSVAKEPRYKNIVHLWEFLLELLASDSCKGIICFSLSSPKSIKSHQPRHYSTQKRLVMASCARSCQTDVVVSRLLTSQTTSSFYWQKQGRGSLRGSVDVNSLGF